MNRLDVEFKGRGWKEYQEWQQEDKKTLKRINKLINSCLRTPFEGLGDPEPLQYDLTGYWSRRINEKDRMVYAVFKDRIEIIQLKYHY